MPGVQPLECDIEFVEERRDERRVQPLMDLVRDPVTDVLQIVDLRGELDPLVGIGTDLPPPETRR